MLESEKKQLIQMNKWELYDRIDTIAKRNEELNTALMKKSAELSEALEEAKNLRTAIEIRRAQTKKEQKLVQELLEVVRKYHYA